MFCLLLGSIRVCRYQRGNQNPYIEEEQTTQWPKEKGQKDRLSSDFHKVQIFTNYKIIILKFVILSMVFDRPENILPLVNEIQCN